ncbi:MAG: transcriptional regulator, LysR family [Gammaproteobacteria bacterium]|nr:transcriptional regulator, LysR family [Gammaproteobacteria bacterium]
MDFGRLKLFAQVAELGSLSKVAVATGSVQSAISRKISSLERECGGRLFNRTGRGVTLTPLGESIFPRVKHLLLETERLASDIKSTAGVPAGEVRVGLMPSLADPLVTQLFRQTREQYPQIRLHLFEGSAGQLDEWLEGGRVDAAALFRYSHSVPRDEELLGTVDTYLVGAPGDRATCSPTVNFSALNNLPLILPGMPNGLRVALSQLAKRKRVNLSVALEADSLPIQKTLASTGDAYAVLGGHTVSADVDANRLQASRIVNPGIKRIVTLATTTHQAPSLAGRKVINLIRQIMHDLFKSGALNPPKR